MIDKLEEECWGLDVNLAKHILPRLLYLKNWVDKYSYPADLNCFEDWDNILQELIWTFNYISRGYPMQAIEYIKNVDFIKEEYNKDSPFCNSEINITYTDKELHFKAVIQDDINISRCRQGLKLFAEYYMDLWF